MCHSTPLTLFGVFDFSFGLNPGLGGFLDDGFAGGALLLLAGAPGTIKEQLEMRQRR